MDWRHRAACRDEDPELFFPVGTSGPALLQIQEAKAVCARCPVNGECLNWALASGQADGVWGGMSEDERRALKRRNDRTNRPAPEPPPVPEPPERGAWCDGTVHQHMRTQENTYLGPNNTWECRDCDSLHQRHLRDRRNARARDRRAKLRKERESRAAV